MSDVVRERRAFAARMGLGLVGGMVVGAAVGQIALGLTTGLVIAGVGLLLKRPGRGGPATSAPEQRRDSRG